MEQHVVVGDEKPLLLGNGTFNTKIKNTCFLLPVVICINLVVEGVPSFRDIGYRDVNLLSNICNNGTCLVQKIHLKHSTAMFLYRNHDQVIHNNP